MGPANATRNVPPSGVLGEAADVAVADGRTIADGLADGSGVAWHATRSTTTKRTIRLISSVIPPRLEAPYTEDDP
jgi:hypothetical protein